MYNNISQEQEVYYRQIDRAKILIDSYTNCIINIDQLISDLEAIGSFFENENWYDNFQTEVNNLEVLNAIKYSDNRTTFTEQENAQAIKSLAKISNLLDKYFENQINKDK